MKRMLLCFCFAAAALPLASAKASTTDTSRTTAAEPSEQEWAIHGQTTFILQANAPFHSPYQGPNSLRPGAHAKESLDLTAYAGFRPWKGAEIWVNPEVDQGFALSNTEGVAGFLNGDAGKVGKANPYLKLPRLFLRQTVDLGGEGEKVDADLNQLAGRQTANRLVLTVGKFSVVDVFDTNGSAHDPRTDFLNWSIIDTGTFDYAANAWGYTVGAAAELYAGRWAVRGGIFDLSKVPNGEALDPQFAQHQFVGEIEERHSIGGRPGKIKITAFLSRGRMGPFEDAIRLSQLTRAPADISLVRRYRSRAGIGLNVEQQVSDVVSVFVRAGAADGGVEPYEYADIDRTIAGGVSLKGAAWDRKDDEIGIAAVNNLISRVHQRYLDAGGLGILVGDGKLPHPGPEQILEAYYSLALTKGLGLTFDSQFVNHPAYNRDRGPVAVGAVRVHGQF